VWLHPECRWVTLPAFGAAAYMPALFLERGLFVRERSDGLYQVVTYLVWKVVEELMIAGVVSLCVSLYVWFGIGFLGNFANFWLVSFSTTRPASPCLTYQGASF
jgi:ATP-binding cassette subfamily G (WHITE) protein 2